MKIGVCVSVCEGEAEMAVDALASLARSLPGDDLRVFLMDDGSRSFVGTQIATKCVGLGLEIVIHRLEKSLGFRGCTERTVRTLRAISKAGTEFDLVIKMDPDSIFLSPALGECLKGVVRDNLNGILGQLHRSRWRDRVLFVADLLPIGFRRKMVDGLISKKWELARTKPVWWSRMGLRAIRHGPSLFSHPGGGFYVITGAMMKSISESGAINDPDFDAYGFVTSEEDLIATVIVRSMGGNIYDLNRITGGRIDLSFNTNSDGIDCEDSKLWVVHPVKNDKSGLRYRENLRQRGLL